MTPETQNQPSPNWHKTTISRSSYLKGRIGWQGLRASEFLEEGPYLITGTDFRNGTIDWKSCYHVTEERYQEAKYIHVKDNDVLITKDGTIGKVAFVRDCPDKAVLNSGIFLLRCNDGSYEHEFMYHLLNSYVFSKFLDDNLAGSTIQHLYQNVFERFEFPIPDKPQQTQIATVLSTIDRAIAQTEALIAKQQRIKTGLMQDLLTKGIDKNGNIRSEATHRFKDSPLGRIPEEWEVSPLYELTSHIIDCPHTTPNFVEDGILIARTFNIKDATFKFDDASFVSHAEYQDRISRLEPQPNDLIFTREAPVGEAFLIPKGMKICLGQRTMLIRCKQEIISPNLLLENIYSENMRIRFDNMVGGTTNPHLNVADIRSLLIKKPPINEQSEIIKQLTEIRSCLYLSQNRKQKLLLTKTGLMQDLLTGKVPVTPLLEQPPVDQT